ncbi:MAG TPA: hypothetical protein VMU30_11530 [Bacteroidota bacterium]|nr:hypothetical protein [Bacteroidota bacterium]
MKNKPIKMLLSMSLVFLGVAVVSWQCIEAPLSPIIPASTISLGSIPLVDITTYFSAYAQKPSSNILDVSGNSGVYDYVNTQVSPKQPFTLPTANATDTSITVTIGKFSIGALSYSSDVSSNLIAGSAPIPLAIHATLPSTTVNDTAQFDYVTLSDTTGNTMTLSVTNSLGIPVTFGDSLVLRNNSASPLDTTKVVAFPTKNVQLASGAVGTYPVSIKGKFLRGFLKTDPISITTGTGTSSANPKLTFALSTSPLFADSAMAVIPQQDVSSPGTQTWQIDDSTVLNEATFDSGKVNLVINNNTGVAIGVKLTVNELLSNTNDAPYYINPTIPSGTKSTSPLDMTQYNIKGGATTGGSGNKFGTQITYTAVVSTLNSNNAKKIISKNDYITAGVIHQSSFILKKVTGRIRTTAVNVDQRFASNISVNDLNGFSGNISLDSLLLYLHIPMGGKDGCPADYNLLITEKNTKHNRIDTLRLTSAVYGRYDPSSPVNSSLKVLSNSDTAFFHSLTRFFPDVPDSFFVKGSVVLDPDFKTNTNFYTFHDTTGLYPTFDIHIPLRFSIVNTSYTQTMAFDSSQIPTDFTKNVGSCSVSFTVVNNLPLQMQMKAEFLKYNKVTRRNDVLFTLPDTSIDKTDIMRINAAPVAASSGWASGTTQSTSTVSLNSTDMTYFNQTDSIRVTLFNLQSTNGQTVRVLGSNYIRIIGIGNITYTIKSK